MAHASTVLFIARTSSAHTVKVLMDTLGFYLNNRGSFTINAKGIFLRNQGHRCNGHQDIYYTLCDMSLYAENFQEYTLRTDEIQFTINLKTFYSEMLKKIRKKDSLILQIIKEDGGMFIKITIGTNDDGNSSSARMAIGESRYVSVDPPEGYLQPITILAKTFQQSCRTIVITNKSTNKHLSVTCWNNRLLQYFATKDGVINEANFGAFEDRSDEKDEKTETFRGTCSASLAIRPTKLATISKLIKIFVTKGLPLMYKVDIETLGVLCIYIKTEEQVAAEKDTAEAEEADEEEEGDTD